MSEADMIIESLKNSEKKVEEFYVSNKTSDKNVANIEELIQEYKTYNDLDGIQDLSIYVNALENLLAERKQDKKYIKNLELALKIINKVTDIDETKEENIALLNEVLRMLDERWEE